MIMDQQDVSLRHLKVLSILLEVGSLTRTAQILDVSQPNVSKTLNRLRAHFGDPLLVRAGLSMRPTPRALRLVEPLRALLSASDTLRSSARAFDPMTSNREFAFLLTDVGMLQIVPMLMRHLEQVGPGLRVRALPLDSRPFETRLESGEGDIALGSFQDAAPTIRRQRLYADGYVSVVRRDHPRVHQLLDPEVFWAERHIVVTSSTTGHDAHRRLELAFMARLDAARIQVRLPSFLAAAFAASGTDEVATIPLKLAAFLADGLRLTVFAPPLELEPIQIAQYWHERVQQDEGHRWLRSTVSALLAHAGTVG
jgi:DNA-binding transcriptional LysR family regulator